MKRDDLPSRISSSQAPRSTITHNTTQLQSAPSAPAVADRARVVYILGAMRFFFPSRSPVQCWKFVCVVRFAPLSFFLSFFLIEQRRGEVGVAATKRDSPGSVRASARARPVGWFPSHSRGLLCARPPEGSLSLSLSLSPLSASGHCRIMNSRHKTEATKRELDDD